MKHSIKKVLNAGWTNFKRNTYLSAAVTGVMALVLMLLLGLIAFQFITTSLVKTIEEKVDISAYFKVSASEAQIVEVKEDLEKLPEVTQVIYVSREQAYEFFKERHADNPLIQESLEQLGENPFEAALNIRAKDPNNYEGVATFLENSSARSAMSEITYNENREVIERVNSLAGGLRTWGLVSALTIAVIAVLITFNTIRLTIYNQKQEIEIMRLVGASNWYIRGPYLAEGAFYGIFAGMIAMLVFYPVIFVISGKMTLLIPGVNLFRYFLVNSWQIAIIVLISGIFLGMASSMIAMRRHLKI